MAAGELLPAKSPSTFLCCWVFQLLALKFHPEANNLNHYSRLALKKYILANNKNVTPGATFDTQLNKAIKSGVEKGEFAQPKGMYFIDFILSRKSVRSTLCLVYLRYLLVHIV